MTWKLSRTLLGLCGIGAALSLGACSSGTEPDHAPSATQGARSSTSGSTTASPPTAPSNSIPKKPVRVQWKTSQRSSGPSNKRFAQKTETPHLKNSPREISRAFDQAVAAQVKDARGYAGPLRNASCGPGGPCSFAMSRIRGGIYQGRYASVLAGMYPYGGGQHPFGFSMGVTLDMRTGDQMALDTFMTASDTKVSNYIDRTLAKKVAGHEVHDEYNYPNIRSEDTAWSVSEAGLTFAFKQGAVAPESEDVVTLTVPWEIARS